MARTNRKDDPAPVVVGRVKKGALQAIVEGLEREAVEEFKKRLLSDESVLAAWEAVLEGVQPEDVMPDLRGQRCTREILQLAARFAEESK